MKSAQQKYFLQKGLSPIAIIIIVLVVGLIAFVIYSKNTKTAVIQEQSQVNLNNSQSINDSFSRITENIETDEYTFYYPKGYIKADPEEDDLVKGYELAYKNSKSTAVFPELILLNVMNNNQKLGAVDHEKCKKISETRRQSTNEVIEVRVINDEKFQGCQFKSTDPIDGVNDAVVSIQNWIWLKDQTNNTSVYVVKGSYYENASKDQSNIINTVVDSFVLK